MSSAGLKLIVCPLTEYWLDGKVKGVSNPLSTCILDTELFVKLVPTVSDDEVDDTVCCSVDDAPAWNVIMILNW